MDEGDAGPVHALPRLPTPPTQDQPLHEALDVQTLHRTLALLQPPPPPHCTAPSLPPPPPHSTLQPTPSHTLTTLTFAPGEACLVADAASAEACQERLGMLAAAFDDGGPVDGLPHDPLASRDLLGWWAPHKAWPSFWPDLAGEPPSHAFYRGVADMRRVLPPDPLEEGGGADRSGAGTARSAREARELAAWDAPETGYGDA
ncbi:unnamed protein product [Symbiodinium sp. KB8]|nr:unnamed protein product [Symbiodinium sp. KB8]